LNRLGILEWQAGAFEQALRYYDRALELFEGLGELANAGLALNSIGGPLEEPGVP